jgi:hypothetical protein
MSPAAAPTFRKHSSAMPSPDEQNIPAAPPKGLRNRYISLSWSYVFWCGGMLLWAIACIVYFALTRQMVEMGIAIFLGVTLILMILGPAFLFGGETWYKRLGWMVVLLCMFSAMWVYPVIAVGLGIRNRIKEGRYSTWNKIFYTDVYHLALCLLTVVVAIWTFVLTKRVVTLTRKLAKGEFGEMDIRVKET